MRDKKGIANETCTHDYYAASMTYHRTRLWNTLYSRRPCIQEEARLRFANTKNDFKRSSAVLSSDVLLFRSTHYDFSEFYICINEKKKIYPAEIHRHSLIRFLYIKNNMLSIFLLNLALAFWYISVTSSLHI